MHGVLNINKPAGISTYDIIRRLRRKIKPKRIGHSGTLDPLATGVVLVLLNGATRVQKPLAALPKEYRAELRFGVQTDTDDITGRTLAVAPVPDVSPAEITHLLATKFTGEILQVPPRFSALKQSGTPLYKLARKGVEIEPRPRRVKIYELELLSWEPPSAKIRCLVSSGTYIRALCRDIGIALGSRATLAGLVRMRVGKFTLETALPLERLETPELNLKELLIPIEDALDFLPKIPVTPEGAQTLLLGKTLPMPPAHMTPDTGLALTEDRRFLALVRITAQGLKTERLIYAAGNTPGTDDRRV